MYFDLTDEQQAIKSTAHDFLASRFKSERLREIAASESGFDESGWKEMAELGWAELCSRFFGMKAGRSKLNPRETCAVRREVPRRRC